MAKTNDPILDRPITLRELIEAQEGALRRAALLGEPIRGNILSRTVENIKKQRSVSDVVRVQFSKYGHQYYYRVAAGRPEVGQLVTVQSPDLDSPIVGVITEVNVMNVVATRNAVLIGAEDRARIEEATGPQGSWVAR